MKTQDAADFFGGRKKLAEALGITPSAVTMWGEFVPESRQYQIQVVTKGELAVDSDLLHPEKPCPAATVA